MRTFLAGLCLLFVPILGNAATTTNDSKNAMLQDLDVVRNHLSVKYAPKAWKQSLLGWDLANVYNNARNRILNQKTPSSKEYRKIFKEFLRSTEDYHVRSIFYSTASAAFPLHIKGTEGRYFITGKNLEITYYMEEALFAFEDLESISQELIDSFERIAIGDEVIAMNGVPIKRVIEGIMEDQLSGDRSPTGSALAEEMLFTRFGKYGDEVPSGNFDITILHKGETTPATYTFPWFSAPEWIKDQNFQMLMKDQLAQFSFGTLDNSKTEKLKTSLAKFLDKDFSVSIAKDLKMTGKKFKSKFSSLKGSEEDKINDDDDDDDSITNESDDEEDAEDDDDREKGFLPPLGKVIWETETNKELYAYLYENSNKQKIGYLYLSSFSYGGGEADEMINEMIKFLNRIEGDNAEMLVIDITNNPGGMVWFMYAVLSLITDQPLKLPTHEELLIPEDVYHAAVLYKSLGDIKEEDFSSGETIQGYVVQPSIISDMRNHSLAIIKAWEEGKQLSPALPLSGLAEVMPHPKKQFNKPIVVLTDELDFSCADFFPAILQDNKRASVFGQRTAGAGGYVRFYPHTSRFGVKGFNMTNSIAYRLDGTPIESLGATPDFPYELTVRDLRENYSDYIKALDEVLLKVASQKQ